MGFVKYSIGGPITSVKDKDSVENKEASSFQNPEQKINVVICKKCGLQHALSENEKRICCGSQLETKLS